MEALQSDVSDVEQQEALLAEVSSKRWLSRPRLAAVVSAVALLSAATFVAKTLGSHTSATLVATGQENPGAGDMDLDTIQAYVTSRVGRTLTPAEMEKVQRFIAGRQEQVQTATGGLKGLTLRALAKVGKEEKLKKVKDEDKEEEISKECKEDMEKFMGGVMEKAAELGLEALLECIADDEGEKCKAATKKLESLEEDTKKECKKNGDICTMIQVFPDKDFESEEDMCIPKSCHQHAGDEANLEMTEALKEEKDCTKCHVSLVCEE